MFKQVLVSVLSYVAFLLHLPVGDSNRRFPNVANEAPKSIAVIGAGSAGLASLKSLLDLPVEVRNAWEIVAYEQRRDVGGIWLPDVNEPRPPVLPETPLYPDLRTNTPSPSMTYPHFPFREGTSLYPGHGYVWQYHRDYVEHFNLTNYVHFNTTVLSANWIGNDSKGHWNVTVQSSGGIEEHRCFDHLIVANGHNHYPHVPTWPGQEVWLASSPTSTNRREILHSIFWRNATRYEGRTVLVVGAGASGSDSIRHVSPVAKKVFLSLRGDKSPPDRIPASYYIRKPGIAYFTVSSVVFTDGSTSETIDSIILATGYEYQVPFLTAGGELIVNSSANSCPEHPSTLTTNLRYIFPLHEHIFSLADAYPTNALAFVGLPMLIANCPSDIAQAVLVAHSIADAKLLPSRTEMLAALKAKEEEMRMNEMDPYYTGHRMVQIREGGGERDMTAQDYQDQLVKFLKARRALPDDGRPYVEQWRRFVTRESKLLWAAWQRLESMGDDAVKSWLEGVKTEHDWVHLMKRLVRWELDQSARRT